MKTKLTTGMTQYAAGGATRRSSEKSSKHSAAAANIDPENRTNVLFCGVCIFIILYTISAHTRGRQFGCSINNNGHNRRSNVTAVHQFDHKSTYLWTDVETFPADFQTGS
jgi:hypothetical protein